ncbi:RsmD family RNA methyltransferase [Spiroplasma endosymbiont of Amphibalanus improvisus]|uniref:RsmD family RNA methyltransferase n=1 Tax=Spiroplasma endosymbiont of Amphibalanus improvisus TaxID=3066327 RepID=UPI00313D5C1A
MRIISGKFKKNKLQTPENNFTRPMTSRVKEDLFNILNNYFIYENKIGLDIFAGTGQLGLEFLSRGGKKCFLNDKSPLVNKMLITNVANCKAENNACILKKDYYDALVYLKINHINIDILFLDPPFKEINYYYKILDYIFQNKIINNFGIIACESEFPLDFKKYNLVELKIKKYPSKWLYVLRFEEMKHEKK